MKKLSLQFRLILSFICIAGTVWLSAGAISWYEGKEQLDEFFDTYQLLLARQLSTADWDNITPETQIKIDNILKNLEDDGDEDEDSLGFAIFNNKGEMIFNDGNDGRIFPYAPGVSGFLNMRIGHKKKLWRILWVKTTNHQYSIAVGQKMKFRSKAAWELVEETLIPWFVGLTILLIASIFIVNKSLRPLKTIAENLRRRSPDDFSPLESKILPSEIKPVVNALNNLFQKISTMLQRERSFITDSAHELRSPLTALKVQLDVALLADDDAKIRNQALLNLGQGVDRAGRLVEQLLALSRLESFTGNNSEKQKLDWQNIIETSIKEHKEAAQNQQIKINFETDNSQPAKLGNPLLWFLLLRNLLDNALRYSPNGENIFIKIQNGSLSVINTGTKVSEKYLPRLSERFFRPPGQTQSGSGLGLSIVERIARLHECSCSFRNSPEGFEVTIKPL